MSSPAPKQELLTSWKEIAAFFGKGIRTVQRWEEVGLPVHRPSDDKNIVMADPFELRNWALRRQARIPSPVHARCEQLIAEARTIAERTRLLIAQSQILYSRSENLYAQTEGISRSFREPS